MSTEQLTDEYWTVNRWVLNSEQVNTEQSACEYWPVNIWVLNTEQNKRKWVVDRNCTGDGAHGIGYNVFHSVYLN